MLDDLRARVLKFHSPTEAIDTATLTGRAMWQMIGVLAEWERTGVKAAKRRGVKFVLPQARLRVNVKTECNLLYSVRRGRYGQLRILWRQNQSLTAPRTNPKKTAKPARFPAIPSRTKARICRRSSWRLLIRPLDVARQVLPLGMSLDIPGSCRSRPTGAHPPTHAVLAACI
jgi:hypothetical protein